MKNCLGFEIPQGCFQAGDSSSASPAAPLPWCCYSHAVITRSARPTGTLAALSERFCFVATGIAV